MSVSQGMNRGLLSEAVRRALRKHLRVLSSVSLALTGGLSVLPAHAELPVICVSGASCGNSSGIITNALQGVSGIAIAGNAMTINQNSASAVLHWRSFNVSSDASVNFVQPNIDSVALNRIYQNSASEIFGHINANGRVYLINQNGIMFGEGAVVNVAGLIASSLDLSSLALDANGVTNLLAPGFAEQAAFQPFRDADGNALLSGDISIGRGATITTKEGGQVFMFAPNVYNAGTIATPGGQTVLAAGDSVFLAASSDANLRGIWVEVGTGGTATNDSVGRIIAERGNITLAGAAVNQLGRLTATTSVNEGGSIRLVARDGGSAPSSGNTVNLTASRGGTLTLGSDSLTEILLETVEGEDEKPATTVDSNPQSISQVVAIGKTITLDQGARIIAPHGDVTLAACDACGSIVDNNLSRVKEIAVEVTSRNDTSRIHLASGSLIDVSGATLGGDDAMSVTDNVIKVELRGDELADSELQRDGDLRGKSVYVDLRRVGTRADGSTWVGSPIGDLSGWAAGVEKTVQQRSLTGGTITMISKGDVVLDRGSTLDISGGWIEYTGGYVNTSNVLGADGRIYGIADADASREYIGVTSSGALTTFDRRWGVTRSYFAGGNQGHYEEGYIEGKDAGTVKIVSNTTALDGTIRAETQEGRYQRRLSTELPEDSTALYRPYDELPLSGTLILGQTEAGGTEPDYAIGDVLISGGTSQPPVANTLLLNTDLFGKDRIGNLELRANGTVTVAQDANVVLSPGGTMDIAAGAIEVAGSITSHGGEIDLTARQTVSGLHVGSGLVVKRGATLDTSGTWVNDTAIANDGVVGTSALTVDGGTVKLQAQQNSLLMETGSVIDVSSGAQLDSNGRLVSGSAGAIALANSQVENADDAVTSMSLNGELRGYGFENGGSLTLQTAAACIASSADGCGQAAEGTLLLAPSFFAAGGFGSYTASSDRGGIEVAAGTDVILRQQNWLQPTTGDLSRFATGTSLHEIATVGLLEDVFRHSVDLTLNAAPRLARNVGYNQQTFENAGSLIIGTGASIVGDVGANITLNSTSRLLVDGTVSAAAGSIQLRLNNSMILDQDAPSIYFADQGIWLGSNAQLLARGAALTQTDGDGRVIGNVFNGGTISLDADRGHVITSSGSLIDVSGASAELSVRADDRGRYQVRQVGSAAGVVDIEASEAIALGGNLQGRSGDPGKLAGGTLRVALDTSNRSDPGQDRPVPFTASALPGGDRTIEVTQEAPAMSFGDSSLPELMLGKAVVASDQVSAGGFDALKLDARTAWTVEGLQQVVHAGRIEFAGDVSVALARSLEMNAAIIASDGGSAVLHAPIVTLGNAEYDHNGAGTQYHAPAVTGTGTLRVEAGQIDVIGSSVLQSLATTTLQSRGDLRLTGVQIDPTQGSTEPPSLIGSLSTAGDITLSAAQVYPTTLTEFTVAAGVGGNTGTLSIKQNGMAGDAFSAGGALTLSAPNVVQSGTVRAPFGTIEIDSPNISLTAGSVTSTSGAGLNVLFGETEGGLNWVYVLGSSKKIVYGGDNRQLVAQRIELNGDQVDFAEGAVLDVRGGGNLIASEFVSGTTGTLDVLGQDNVADSFAVIPAGNLASAAYDLSIYSDAEFQAGKSIYLSGTEGVPAGEYIVLPAKYALLPGAYLVTPVAGHQDIVAGESYRQADGSNVISGYFTNTGSGGLRDSARTSGFAVIDGKAAQNKAKYTITNANDFFAASGESVATQRLPKDAGTVAITANRSLALEGSLRAGAAEGGRGAALDIASSAIEVVANADAIGATPGVLLLDVADLNALGAESILLGGVRGETEDGLGIATRSSTVTIADGAALAAPEVMLAATQTVTVEHNASVTARGAEVSSQDVSLTGDGAFVRVATGEAANVSRTGAADAGRVIVADGATLSAAAGSISLESSGDAQLAGVLSAVGGEVSLTGDLISLGNVDPAVSGWVLDAAQLSHLDAATLRLNSRSSIDWYGNVDLAFTNIGLNARALRGYNDGTVAIAATGNVTFSGVEAASPVDSLANGQLHVTANNVVFDGGEMQLSGFDSVALLANREVVANEDTSFTVAGGGLQLGAQRITTQSGADLSISAEGAATLSNSGSTQALAAVNELGGSFTLNASAIELATRIELPTGLVTLNATDATAGGITLTGTAAVDTSGRATEFGDQVAYSHGGNVRLATASGDLTLAEGSRIDVSATGGANAGGIELAAAGGNLQLAGVLNGSAQAGGAGASFSADAQSLGDFNALTQRIGAAGFGGDLSFRQRGAGDLTVATGATVRGTSVAMTADQGNIVVAGSIVAHDDAGGRINLSARGGMTISGTLDARATSNQERNGRISLNVSEGGLNVTDSAVLATVGTSAARGTTGDGNVSIRLPQGSLLTVVDADAGNDAVRLGGDWSRTAGVSVEGFSTYTDADGILDANEVVAFAGNPIYDAAAAFAARTDEVAAALSNSTMPALDVVTGIEIRSGATDGSLALNADWNMAAWRFADADGALTKTGVLTLRAAGDLIFNQSLSDGFADENTFRLTPGFGDSWSYNLVAGADTSSANVMATNSSTGVGSVLINGGPDGYSTANFTVVRTGTGSIDVAAARDIVLSNDAAMIYTAGEATDGMIYATVRGQGNQLGALYYPANGGDVTLSAGRDIVGGTTDQLMTEWLWRIGKIEEGNQNPTRSTAWTVNFAEFHHGVGALGGGDVTVKAGNDVRDLSVASTTIGRQRANSTGDKTAAANDLEVIGGGNVSVAAGNDIVGGTYYAGRGQMSLQAEGGVRVSAQNGVGPVLLLGDTQAEVIARQDVILGGVATPTLLPQGSSQGSQGSTDSGFSTYSTDSSLSVRSTAGDVSVVADKTALLAAFGNLFDGGNYDGDQMSLAFSLLPGSVDVLALRGNADFAGTLIPDENGSLSVRAYQDVNFDVILSDVDASALPNQDRPSSNAFATDPTTPLHTALTTWQGTIPELFNALTPVRMGAAEQGTLSSSRIIAATGDVTGSGYFGAPLDIHAGRDVVDLNVIIQNLVSSNVSSITAGRDLYYTASQGSGGLTRNDNEIVVDGPGQLLLTAGGNIDLATSRGVTTRGDEVNPGLADTGASITALAGLSGEAPDYAAFATDYIQESDAYLVPLMDYLEASTGRRPVDAAEARAAFASLDSKQQRLFLYRVLLAEVRLSAEEAASVEKKDDYSRGFTALETLFPGATDAEDNPYRGDISLLFSRIYTLDGGGINLLTPGGGVNAGLAADTLRRFGITKDSSELGLVTRRGGDIGIIADGDVQVNESRIFAVNDSDIVVWSSNGDVDAGRGAKTAVSAPTFSVTYDQDGHAFVTYDAALSGSGIQARTATADQKRGNVVLAAPRGVVNAGDAGIVAGNLTIAATAVLGADNISVTGVAVGVPVDTGGLGASLAGVASAASSASNSAATTVDDGSSRDQSNAPMSQAALSWLDVFVIGLGEEGCKGDDVECLKRQSTTL